MLQHGVMVDQLSPESDGISQMKTHKSQMNVSELPAFMASVGHLEPGVEFNLPTPLPAYMRLNLEELNCFEVVERQFEKWGVLFENAIALSPSNPAFPTHSGRIVLMGAPKCGLIEVSFLEPVSFVTALVTSSRRTVLSAYDRDGNQIAHTEMVGPNLAGSQSAHSPNAELSVSASQIHRVSFYAFEGHMTVADFGFCF